MTLHVSQSDGANLDHRYAYQRDASMWKTNGIGGKYHAPKGATLMAACGSNRVMLDEESGVRIVTLKYYQMCQHPACMKRWREALRG